MMKITYYECTNPECGLRFPHHTEFDGRCPKCLGGLRIKEQFVVPDENQSAIPKVLPLAVILDNIRSGFNVGAILRTSECLGVKKLGLGGITPGIDETSVSKTSLGAENNFEILRANRTLDLVHNFKDQGYQIWALETTSEAKNIYTLDIPSVKIAVVVGNERCGVDPQILKVADRIIMIPMAGIKRSLNVEVSLGVALGCLNQKLNIQ